MSSSGQGHNNHKADEQHVRDFSNIKAKGKKSRGVVEMHGQSQGATILSESTLQQQEREQLLKNRNYETIGATGI